MTDKTLTQQLIDQGKLIEAGWVGLRIASVPAEASELQIAEMRNCFFAGAHHLMQSILHVLDPGDAPTANDMNRLDQINAELNTFIEVFMLKNFPAQGRG